MNTTDAARFTTTTATGEGVHVRGVTAGCYRGRSEDRAAHTHMVHLDAEGNDVRLGCRLSVEKVVDVYGGEDAGIAPTCPTCAKKWAKLMAK